MLYNRIANSNGSALAGYIYTPVGAVVTVTTAALITVAAGKLHLTMNITATRCSCCSLPFRSTLHQPFNSRRLWGWSCSARALSNAVSVAATDAAAVPAIVKQLAARLFLLSLLCLKSPGNASSSGNRIVPLQICSAEAPVPVVVMPVWGCHLMTSLRRSLTIRGRERHQPKRLSVHCRCYPSLFVRSRHRAFVRKYFLI